MKADRRNIARMEKIPVTYDHQKYDRFHKTYPLDAVLPFIVNFKAERDYDGNKIKLFSIRLQTFVKSGTQCIKCGLKGEFFAAERTCPNSRYHFNLYGSILGEEILFTKDHIIPKSKGGLDILKNMQTMCIICNKEKGDKYE